MRELTTRDWQLFIEKMTRKRSDLSSSTRNMLMATFRNVLKIARDDGLIDIVPATPRQRQKDNPRAFFRFHPYSNLNVMSTRSCSKARRRSPRNAPSFAASKSPLSCMTSFSSCVHSFVRPTTTELYALKHNDITVETDPKRLLVTVRNGKTGYQSRQHYGRSC